MATGSYDTTILAVGLASAKLPLAAAMGRGRVVRLAQQLLVSRLHTAVLDDTEPGRLGALDGVVVVDA